jgi:hypothetical protein
MSQIPSLAVVVQGNQVQFVTAQDWPGQIPLSHIVVVDYDTDGMNELTSFSIGNTPQRAWCYRVIPDRYETFIKAALSPRAVLTALGEPVDSGWIDPRENRVQTPIESSLTDFLTGYVHHDPARREQVRNFPDWREMARQELRRRNARFLEVLPDEDLDAIARGEVDMTELLGKIPTAKA